MKVDDAEDEDTVEKRLDELPADLFDLYSHMLEKFLSAILNKPQTCLILFLWLRTPAMVWEIRGGDKLRLCSPTAVLHPASLA